MPTLISTEKTKPTNQEKFNCFKQQFEPVQLKKKVNYKRFEMSIVSYILLKICILDEQSEQRFSQYIPPR